MKKERWYVSVLHLRGRNESTFVSTVVLVSLDGIFGFGRTSTISNKVLPQPIIPSRLTRTTVDTNVLSFRPRKCKTLTYQRSFFIRVVRTYNSLPESLRQKNLSLVRFRSFLLELPQRYKSSLRCGRR